MPIRPFAITMGDPAGIGPEIIVKLYRNHEARGAIVIGDANSLSRAAKQLGGIEICKITEPLSPYPKGSIPVLQAGPALDNVPLGQISAEAGSAAYAAIERAIQLAKAGETRGIVTAPIHKEALK